MQKLREVNVGSQSPSRFSDLIGPERGGAIEAAAKQLSQRLAGRTIWNVNSTAQGGGVAEMLRSLVAYARGAGLNARWVVIDGLPEFFRLTKRLHNAIHGSDGDGSALGEAERKLYERTMRANAVELCAVVQRGDVVLLHDPQTAGLIPDLVKHGAIAIWRCHIGSDAPSANTELGWGFLEPYLEAAHAIVFSREAYVPPCCDHARAVVIPPSIDPFSAKNQELDEDTCRAILVHVGLVEGPAGPGTPTFTREDGSPGRVDHCVDVQRLGRASLWETPLVVQVSRWDRLKDPVGVLRGFEAILHDGEAGDAELVLAGPNVCAVADDPEGAAVYDEVCDAWRSLPHARRKRVHLASLPMSDVEENAAIVNALQRHAAVVVQKSLQEGFGLTVTEAMWKARPVIASAVGGIQDQIDHGVHGILLKDPRDTEEFAGVLRALLGDPATAVRLGANARAQVRERYLGASSLIQYSQLIERLDG